MEWRLPRILFLMRIYLFLCEVLRDRAGLDASPNKDDQWVLYIHSESMPRLSQIVKPYMIPSLLYKLGRYKA